MLTRLRIRLTNSPGAPHGILFFLGLCWTLYLHGSLLNSGYLGDDAYNSQMSGTLIHLDISIWRRTVDEVLGWMWGAGRIYPLSFFWTYYLFNFVHSIVVFKLTVLGVVFLSVFFFGLLTFELTSSKRTAILAVILMPILFQYREWFDPIIAFCFLIPMLACQLFLSWLLWIKYLRSSNPWQKRGSVVFFLASLLTYELSYPLGFIHFLFSWVKTRRISEAIRISLPIIVINFGVVLTAILMRSPLNPKFKNAYPGSSLALDFTKNLKAFYIQVAAPLPGIYNSTRVVPWMSSIQWVDALPLGLAAILVWSTLRSFSLERKTNRLLFYFGLILWAFPALLIAVSGHRDNIIGGGLGVGYLPVYIQYFGVFFVFLSIFSLIACKLGLGPVAQTGVILSGRTEQPNRSDLVTSVIRHFIVTLATVLVAITSIVHLGQNRYVIEKTNQVWNYPRRVTESALRFGLFKELPNEFMLSLNDRYAFDHYWFFSTHSRKKVHTTNSTGMADLFIKGTKNQIGPTPRYIKFESLSLPTYLLTYQFDPEKGRKGFVYLAKLAEASYDFQTKSITSLKADSLRIFDYQRNTIEAHQPPPGVSIDFFKLMKVSSESPAADDWKPIVRQAHLSNGK